MNLPSGDQTGLAEISSRSLIGEPPSAGTLKMRLPPPSLAVTAIHLPSGDQEGAFRTSSDSAMVLTFVPSPFIVYSFPRPSLRRTKLIRLPSSETPGVETRPPSFEIQNSEMAPDFHFQIPSAPPR